MSIGSPDVSIILDLSLFLPQDRFNEREYTDSESSLDHTHSTCTITGSHDHTHSTCYVFSLYCKDIRIYVHDLTLDMVKKKAQSKRMPARMKYKIEKKVKEHRRKLRKEERKKGDSKKRMKKDPGIPNLYPFKEQTLKQLKEQKEREIENQKRQKEARKREQTKRRSLQGLRVDVERRTKAFEKKHSSKQDTDQNQLSAVQSTRRFYKEFKKIVDAADVVLEILDARDPLGCRCPQMEQTILGSGTNKKLILVLNKIDLVPRENVKKWLKYLRNEFPTVAFKSSTQSQKHNLSRKKFALESGPVSMENSSVCLGSEALMKMLGNYSRSLSLKTSITVGIVGLPNVGKSSVINSLKRSRVCTVGSIAGVTKTVQKVKLDSHIELLDSPGIVMGNGVGDDPRMALRNCMKVELLSDVISPVESIISRCNSVDVMKHYCIPAYEGVMEFLTLLAKKMGKLKKGGIPDTDAAARAVLHDWNSGRINFFTQPPEQLSSHVSADIVSEWGKAFDMPSVSTMDEDLLSGLTEKLKNIHVCIEPSDPVELIVDQEESEVEEVVVSDEMCSSSGGSEDEEMEEDRAGDHGIVVSMKPKKHTKTTDNYDFSSLMV